jgi:hypothetical protein
MKSLSHTFSSQMIDKSVDESVSTKDKVGHSDTVFILFFQSEI